MKKEKILKKIRRNKRKQLLSYKLIQIQQKKKWKRERKIARLRGEMMHLFFEGYIKLYRNTDPFPIETLTRNLEFDNTNTKYKWNPK